MKRIQKIAYAVTAALLLCGLTHAAFAQPDPPSRVARLNLIEGNISCLPSGGDDNDWVAAVPNRPLTIGDRLWADQNSRAELHIGSSALRLDSNTGISFLNLDDSIVQIRVSDGSMVLRLRRLDPGETFEVDTSNVAFVISRPGYYRIDSRHDSDSTVITVRQGAGEATGGGRSFQIISDQQVTLRGTDSLSYDLQDADSFPTSEFDNWAMKRDAREDHIASAKYVPPDMTGYEDLDSYGSWRPFPEYGYCWVPAGLPAGWAPYRFGHWVWIAPWGWTWVDDAPWGFAPFHYGRWAYAGTAWVWIPGPIAVRPVYAPALVAWVGGSGFNLSLSLGPRGGVGWFPLGPREVYVPTYRVSERYVTNINVTNTVVNRTTIVNVYNNRSVSNVAYVNQRAPGAVTVVSHETFVNARPVGRNVVNVPARVMAAAPVSHEIPATPERASVYGAGNHNAPHPPVQSMNRTVVARQAPPPAPNHFERPQSMERPQNAQPPQNVQRPQNVQPPQNAQPPQNRVPDRPPNRASNAQPNQSAPAQPSARPNPAQQQPRPLARTAPPVRPPTASEKTDMQNKQRAWQNAHPRKNEDQQRRQ